MNRLHFSPCQYSQAHWPNKCCNLIKYLVKRNKERVTVFTASDIHLALLPRIWQESSHHRCQGRTCISSYQACKECFHLVATCKISLSKIIIMSYCATSSTNSVSQWTYIWKIFEIISYLQSLFSFMVIYIFDTTRVEMSSYRISERILEY